MPTSGPEAKIQRSIMAWLREQDDTWAFVVHGGPFQQAGVPDILACSRGRFCAIECKTPTGRVTPIQGIMLSRIAAAGGLSGVAHSLREAQELLGATAPTAVGL